MIPYFHNFFKSFDALFTFVSQIFHICFMNREKSFVV